MVILDWLAKDERATKLTTELGIENATITNLKKNPIIVVDGESLSIIETA